MYVRTRLLRQGRHVPTPVSQTCVRARGCACVRASKQASEHSNSGSRCVTRSQPPPIPPQDRLPTVRGSAANKFDHSHVKSRIRLPTISSVPPAPSPGALPLSLWETSNERATAWPDEGRAPTMLTCPQFRRSTPLVGGKRQRAEAAVPST